MSAKTVVIAQPTFLPWAGWFDLADQADVLILLDDVAFSKQSWQQRNRIRTSEGLSYLTVPVRTSGRLGQRIVDTDLASVTFVEKLLRTIGQSYARAPYLGRYFQDFSAVMRQSAASSRLVDLNCGLIAWLADVLGIMTPRVRSSEMGVEGKRGEHVALLCESVQASRYLSPAGAEDYLLEDRDEFDRRRISVQLHVYAHPIYRQCFQPFTPYATVLDLLFNEGDAAATILRSGRRQARELGTPAEESQHVI
jgi:hypothetical protein